jgi:hypothetical protein
MSHITCILNRTVYELGFRYFRVGGGLHKSSLDCETLLISLKIRYLTLFDDYTRQQLTQTILLVLPPHWRIVCSCNLKLQLILCSFYTVGGFHTIWLDGKIVCKLKCIFISHFFLNCHIYTYSGVRLVAGRFFTFDKYLHYKKIN